MAKTKTTYHKFTTPAAPAIWPKLDAPDYKFKEEGEYSVQLAFTPEQPDHAEFLAKLEEAYVSCIEEARSMWTDLLDDNAKLKAKFKNKPAPVIDRPWSMELDNEGNETGRVLARFKLKAKYKSRKTDEWVEVRPALFDAKLTPLPHGTHKVGGGSILRVNFEAHAFAAAIGIGMTMKLRAVQIIKLEVWGGLTADSAGFEAQDDGYEANLAAEEPAEMETTKPEPGDSAEVSSGADY